MTAVALPVLDDGAAARVALAAIVGAASAVLEDHPDIPYYVEAGLRAIRHIAEDLRADLGAGR